MHRDLLVIESGWGSRVSFNEIRLEEFGVSDPKTMLELVFAFAIAVKV